MHKPIYVTKSSMPPYEEYIEEIKCLWETGILTNQGKKYQELETEIKKYLGVKNIQMYANGHLALENAVEALGIEGEVITTPFTFASTTHAIVRNGLTPVFCDIDPDTYTIDVNKIEDLITEKTSAILPVHVYGNVCDVEKIEKIAKKHNLKVIYDAAHVFGVKYNDIPIGCFGDMSMFSFHATKVYHTVEGGGLVYNDESFTEKLKQLRQFGMDGQESVPLVGTNAKMTEIHAAMGICNLRHVDKEILKRKKVFERYCERLNLAGGIKLFHLREGVKPNYAYFPVVFDGYKYNRDEIKEKLEQNNIYARKYFYPLTSSFECYKDKFKGNYVPVAEEIASKVLCLPMYADLSIDDVDRICDIILD